MKYLVVIEKGDTSFGAHVPDLPGCVAVADTRDKVIKLIHEAIELHLKGGRQCHSTPMIFPQKFIKRSWT